MAISEPDVSENNNSSKPRITHSQQVTQAPPLSTRHSPAISHEGPFIEGNDIDKGCDKDYENQDDYPPPKNTNELVQNDVEHSKSFANAANIPPSQSEGNNLPPSNLGPPTMVKSCSECRRLRRACLPPLSGSGPCVRCGQTGAVCKVEYRHRSIHTAQTRNSDQRQPFHYAYPLALITADLDMHHEWKSISVIVQCVDAPGSELDYNILHIRCCSLDKYKEFLKVELGFDEMMQDVFAYLPPGQFPPYKVITTEVEFQEVLQKWFRLGSKSLPFAICWKWLSSEDEQNPLQVTCAGCKELFHVKLGGYETGSEPCHKAICVEYKDYLLSGKIQCCGCGRFYDPAHLVQHQTTCCIAVMIYNHAVEQGQQSR